MSIGHHTIRALLLEYRVGLMIVHHQSSNNLTDLSQRYFPLRKLNAVRLSTLPSLLSPRSVAFLSSLSASSVVLLLSTYRPSRVECEDLYNGVPARKRMVSRIGAGTYSEVLVPVSISIHAEGWPGSLSGSFGL